jgi:Arc/MetJ-type ribon-helix-helix transcriptional regulator
VEVPLELERRIRTKVRDGTYESFDHFVSIALENQLRVEEGDLSVWPSVVTEHREKPSVVSEPVQEPSTDERRETMESILPKQSKKLLFSLKVPIGSEIELLQEPRTENLVGTLLWGQFYKFLPEKVALRVLTSMSTETLPMLAAFKEKACDIAQTFGAILNSKDREFGRKSGERLSTSFPEPTAKSRRRYKDQYIGYVRPSDGKLDGFLPSLRFLNVAKEQGAYKVGITQSGLEFARLPNPLIDGEVDINPLSTEEIAFLIKHIVTYLPNEASHMKTMLHLIDEGISSRSQLNSKMADFYIKYQDPNSLWTSAHSSTKRAGLLSRMVELGLIEKSKLGLEVKHQLTARGKQVLENELRGIS